MKKRILLHGLYWGLILAFLTLFFGNHWESPKLAFYFSILLLPIVMGTTYFFNHYLVPRYLLKGKYAKFGIYFFYMLVVSLYLEMLVSLAAFVFIAGLNVDLINLEGISIFILGVTLYLIIFASSFIRLVFQFQQKEALVENLQSDKVRNDQNTINIRANRQNNLVELGELLYLESLSDYVKVVSVGSELITREKITRLSAELPDHFVRIHRSFVVNAHKVDSFKYNEVVIQGQILPISRSYKQSALEVLNNKKSAEKA